MASKSKNKKILTFNDLLGAILDGVVLGLITVLNLSFIRYVSDETDNVVLAMVVVPVAAALIYSVISHFLIRRHRTMEFLAQNVISLFSICSGVLLGMMLVLPDIPEATGGITIDGEGLTAGIGTVVFFALVIAVKAVKIFSKIMPDRDKS